MTEHILRALGGTDEKYILACAEKMKEKNPKKIVLRRWLSAAAAVIVVIGIVLALPTVRQTLFPKPAFRRDFDSFEEMMEARGTAETDSIPYGTRLSALDFSRFDHTNFYVNFPENRHGTGKSSSDYSLASLVSPFVYVCELEKDGVRYEVVYYEEGNSLELPKRFRNTEKYPDTVVVGDLPVSYLLLRDRSECEFTDATGYYKIICHDPDKYALSDMVEMLLGSPLFSDEGPHGPVPIDDYILVGMAHEYSYPEEDYPPEYFHPEYVEQVETISAYHEGGLNRKEDFSRVEKLYLTEKEKKNIDSLLAELNAREDILHAERDYLFLNVTE